MGPYLKLGGIGGAPLVDIRWEARCSVFWVLSHWVLIRWTDGGSWDESYSNWSFRMCRKKSAAIFQLRSQHLWSFPSFDSKFGDLRLAAFSCVSVWGAAHKMNCQLQIRFALFCIVKTTFFVWTYPIYRVFCWLKVDFQYLVEDVKKKRNPEVFFVRSLLMDLYTRYRTRGIPTSMLEVPKPPGAKDHRCSYCRGARQGQLEQFGTKTPFHSLKLTAVRPWK